MFLFKILLLILFSPQLVSCTSIEHQWVSWDGVGDTLDDVPVLHTAFVQTGEELHYFSESSRYEADMFVGHRIIQDQSGKSSTKEKIYHVRTMLPHDDMPFEFDPPFIDFGEGSVGIAIRRRVLVKSRVDQVVILDSISGGTVSFHSSFFDILELPPLAATSFEIAFLPREEGKTTTTLRIHTSVGTFLYEVIGDATSNPYRIPPFVGNRIAFNGSISREITIHNPHSKTLRIKELISSGVNVHTELAYDVDPLVAGEPVQYWDIRPFQTKTVGRIFVVAHVLENNTNYVLVSGRLLDDNGNEAEKADIVLSVPYEVVKKKGVYTTNDLLDFGLLKAGERSEYQMFSVYQYQIEGKLEFETLYVEKGDSTGIYMEFASNPPIAVHPGYNNRGEVSGCGKPVNLVKVFFDASRIQFPNKEPGIKKFSGRIIAVSRGGNYNITIPFKASVFQGNLRSVDNDLAIHDNIKPPHKRNIRLKNNLPFAVSVWNISLSSDARNYFTVRLFDRTSVIPQGEERSVFLLKYNKKIPTTFGSALIYIHTNVSTFRVQLHKYSGKIEVELFSVDQDAFDFGLIAKNDTRAIRFAIKNPNKAIMTIRNLHVPNMNIHRLYFVDTIPQAKKEVFVSNDDRLEWEQNTDLEIPAERTALFDFELRAPFDGVERDGEFVISTDYDSKKYPVSYKIGHGMLASIPEVLSFGATHPGKVVYRTLHIFNSFDHDMVVQRVSTLSRDSRFYFENLDTSSPPTLRSGRLTNLGRVMFMPEAPCAQEECYLGLPLHTPDGQWFVHGLTLPANLAEVDSYLYKKQRAKFDNLVKEGKHIVNTTIVIDTDKAKNIKIPTTAEMVWPRLLTRNSVHFPMTALGNFTIVNLTLSNPTAVPIAVQVIPLVIYPDADAVVEFFKDHLLTPLHPPVEMNETLMFSLRDTELFTLKPDSPVPRLREELEEAVPQTVPRFTLSLILKPHMKVRLRLGFLPSDLTLRSSLLLIRNNLTIIEPVVVYGRGARNEMQMEGIKARSKTPLLFEIRHDHLTDCNNPKRLMHKLSSTLTVRRPFTVSNTGEVSFTVVNMSINGVPCENRGFRILNCYPFRLQPNESYSLDVAYTPDFLTTTNEADLQLYMHMNGSAWVFPLSATVPQDMMARCHRALPRPPFENLMYYSCVTALVFCLICVLACAYLEGDRTISCAIREQLSAQRPVFDLNDTESLLKQSNQHKTRTDVWKESSKTPSDIQVADDASTVSRIFFKLANQAIKAVHLVWRWSLLYRNKEEPTRTVTKPKKKKAQVPVVSEKPKEQPPPKEKFEQANGKEKSTSKEASSKPQPAPSIVKTPPVVPAPVTTAGHDKKKNNNNNKLSAKTSMSPKANVQSKNNRKKSSASDNEKRLQKTEQLMDNFSSSTTSSSTTTAHSTTSQKRSAASPGAKTTQASSSTSTTPTRSSMPPIKLPTPETSVASNVPTLSTPMTVSIPPAFSTYQQNSHKPSPDFLQPTTPTPSIASSFDFGQKLALSTTDSCATSREPSSTRKPPARKRNPSESELSMTSELGQAPDWLDASVNMADVDDDFSRFAAPSSEMMCTSESEFGDQQSSLNANKRKVRRGRRGKGQKKEESQSERDAQIQLNALAEVMRKNAGLLPTSTGLPTLPLDYQGMMETLYPNAFDPTTLSSMTSPGTDMWGTDLLNPLTTGLGPSLAPGTNWLPSASDSLFSTPLTSTNTQTTTTTSNNLANAFNNPLTWDLDQNNSVFSGSMFQGYDFNLWSDNRQSNSSAPWPLDALQKDDQDVEPPENKKN